MSADYQYNDSPYLRQLELLVPPVFSGCRGEGGSRTLGSLSAGLSGFVPPAAIQGRDDLLDIATAKTAGLLGPETARAFRTSLEESFVALTANHHVINTLPDFTQGLLVYALRQLSGEGRAAGAALPVLAAGGVPMSDFTYPCGILLGRPRQPASTAGARLKLFKPKARKTLVNRQPAFAGEDVARALAQVSDEKWLRFERKVLRAILEGILSGRDVLEQPLYSRQCTVINAKLWPRLFKPGIPVPRLVMLDKLELERDLLLADLKNENSLAHAILFEPDLRDAVARNLNGNRGCWTCNDLDDGTDPSRGSLFFWGIDREGRMFPLHLDRKRHRLVSARVPSFTQKLTPGAVWRSLEEGSLLPGLYLGFAAMALARGLLCCGGVFQTGYLRRMRDRTAASLAGAGRCGMAARLEALPDAPFTSGFLPLGFDNGIDPPYAAGAIEMLAAGGLSVANLETLRSITLSQALESSYDYIYELAVPSGQRLPGWREALRHGYGMELSPAPEERIFTGLRPRPGRGSCFP